MFDEVDVDQVYDRAIVAVPVLPAYEHHPQYVGVLQWCSGPNVPSLPGALPSIAFQIQCRAANGKGPMYYFRAIRLTLSLMDCSKRRGDNAVLTAFQALCDTPKIIAGYGRPFEEVLADPYERQVLLDFITEHFNLIHEN